MLSKYSFEGEQVGKQTPWGGREGGGSGWIAYPKGGVGGREG